jgi:hypothetical protein
VLALGCLATGCGASKGQVTGKVLQKNGSPVPGGTVTFFPQGSGNPTSAVIGPDGKYDMKDVPAGPVQIAVETESMRPGSAKAPIGMASNPAPAGRANPGGGPPKDALADKGRPAWEGPAIRPGKYLQISKKFARPDTSGLTLDVKGGKQEHDIQLPE